VARTIVWTDSAATDLELVVQHIARDSKIYAAAFAREVQAAAASLATLSHRGRIVPELNDPAIRELFVRKYRLMYQVRSDRVEIVAFVHGATQLGPPED
jgi:plasmid stabilization system protein ParE